MNGVDRVPGWTDIYVPMKDEVGLVRIGTVSVSEGEGGETIKKVLTICQLSIFTLAIRQAFLWLKAPGPWPYVNNHTEGLCSLSAVPKNRSSKKINTLKIWISSKACFTSC